MLAAPPNPPHRWLGQQGRFIRKGKCSCLDRCRAPPPERQPPAGGACCSTSGETLAPGPAQFLQEMHAIAQIHGVEKWRLVCSLRLC